MPYFSHVSLGLFHFDFTRLQQYLRPDRYINKNRVNKIQNSFYYLIYVQQMFLSTYFHG